MSADPRLVQSVRQRLTNIARRRGEDVQRVLLRYAIERLLFRLSQSRHRDRFVLKGAMLFSLWADVPYRSTGDLDLLGRGDNSLDWLKTVFAEIVAVEASPPDAIIYDLAGLRAQTLRPDADYTGASLRFDALLGRARLPIWVDIGFGDVVTPAPCEVDFPSLLDMPSARVRAYPPETVIAEKLEAMVSRGLATSRIKDFYDLWAIATALDLDGATVADAVRKTFAQRRTALPGDVPSPLTEAFWANADKQRLWVAFIGERAEIAAAPKSLRTLCDANVEFVRPIIAGARLGSPIGVWRSQTRSWSV